jgi:hypothetical protein
MGDTWPERIRWLVGRYGEGSGRGLARKLGISGESVNAWLRGDYAPGAEQIAAIIRKYPELNPVWLLTGEPPRERPGGSDREAAWREGAQAVLRDLRQMTEELARAYGNRETPRPRREPPPSPVERQDSGARKRKQAG